MKVLPFFAAARSGRQIDLRRFAARRALRILPLYYAAVLATGAGFVLAGANPLRILPYFLFLNALPHVAIPMMPYSLTWWSLATEAQFYVLLPLLAPSLKRRWLGALLLGSFAAAYGAFLAGVLRTPATIQAFGTSVLGRGPLFLAGMAAAWIFVHHGPRLVPADPQQPAGPLHRLALQQHVDHEPLKEDCEPAPRLGPRGFNLHDAVLRTVDPRQPRLEERLELARVQVPPRPLRAVVVHRQLPLTVRTPPPHVGRMLHTDLDPLLRHVLRDEGLTRGLGDIEARMLIEWVTDWTELLADAARTEDDAWSCVRRLCRRARAIGRFVRLWTNPDSRGAAGQLAAAERFSWPEFYRRVGVVYGEVLARCGVPGRDVTDLFDPEAGVSLR